MKSSCDYCSCEYIKKKSWQRFCSKRCKDKEFYVRNPEARSLYNSKQSGTPISRYHVQKQGAKRRGIAFYLTFEEWWELWEPYWEFRGRDKDSLVMCRIGDKGSYEVGNVYIDTYSNNCREAGLNSPSNRDQVTGRFI